MNRIRIEFLDDPVRADVSHKVMRIPVAGDWVVFPKDDIAFRVVNVFLELDPDPAESEEDATVQVISI